MINGSVSQCPRCNQLLYSNRDIQEHTAQCGSRSRGSLGQATTTLTCPICKAVYEPLAGSHICQKHSNTKLNEKLDIIINMLSDDK